MSQVISKTVSGVDEKLQWDLYSQRSWETEVHLKNQEIENVRSPLFEEGFAVRIIRDKGKGPDGENVSGIGIAPGSTLQKAAEVSNALNFAVFASKLTTFPSYGLSAKTDGFPSVKIVDPKIRNEDLSLPKDTAEEVLSLLSKDQEIKLTFCKLRFTTVESKLENCLGLHAEKRETFCYFEAGLSPKPSNDGRLAEYWPRILARRVEDLELSKNVPIWMDYAKDSLNAVLPETGKYDLIIPPDVLFEMAPPVVAFQASASSFKRGLSRWKERGQKIWSEKITIEDDGLIDYGIGTSPFDDEGTPQSKTEIIRSGEFRNYITNRMYSRFVGSENSTGNAVKFGRSGGALCYSGDVGLGETNMVMGGGDSSLDEMIKETRRGLLMVQFSWMLPDPVTGSFGAEIRHAYLVENGQVTKPIKGGVVNGSFFDESEEKGVFNTVDLISKDRKMTSGSFLPWVHFPELRVSGK
jgi:PmbA protein